MADIIDNAAEIEELQRNLSLQKYKSDSNAPSATHCCISVEDLPAGWGLLHVVNGRVRKVHGWPKGNCCWGNPDDKPFTGNKQVECDYMLSALRRMELRGHLNEIYDGVIVNKKEGNAA
ncbi:hypothetical protein FQB88_002911 [Escherichia coli]|nr:hypothetical protein [Escherichia coli]